MTADRRDDDRRRVARAEDLGAHVDLLDIDQPPRPQLELEEAFAVRAQRHLVVDAGGHVAEVRRRHVLPRHRLEIEHVDRFLRALDQLVRLERGPRDGVGRARLRQELREHRRAGGGDRACGQELQEPATIVDRHGDLLPPPVYAGA